MSTKSKACENTSADCEIKEDDEVFNPDVQNASKRRQDFLRNQSREKKGRNIVIHQRTCSSSSSTEGKLVDKVEIDGLKEGPNGTDSEEKKKQNMKRDPRKSLEKMHAIHSRSLELKAATIKQHYYPEGGWGWVIVGVAFIVYASSYGVQLSFGIIVLHFTKQSFFGDNLLHGNWIVSISYALSVFLSPIVVAFCRKKSVRLSGIVGGLIASLGSLFASFASEPHQVFISYALFLAFGFGVIREVANLMVGQYFKRRRILVEVFLLNGIGFGISVFAPLINYFLSKLAWRGGFQVLALILLLPFILGTLYRSASLYHPQRRAIVHLKTQRRKIREKAGLREKVPFFDFTPLKEPFLKWMMFSTMLSSFGYLSTLFYLAKCCRSEEVESRKLEAQNETVSDVANFRDNAARQMVFLHILLGISFCFGVTFYGYLFHCQQHQYHPNRHHHQSGHHPNHQNDPQKRTRKKFVCISSLIGISVSLLAFLIFECNPFVNIVRLSLYGFFLGGYHYSSKMLVFTLIRTRLFAKAWSYVQWASAVGLTFGLSLNSYLIESHFEFSVILSSFLCSFGCLALVFLPSNPRKTHSDFGRRSMEESSPGGTCKSWTQTGGKKPESSIESPPLASIKELKRNEEVVKHCTECGHQFDVLEKDEEEPELIESSGKTKGKRLEDETLTIASSNRSEGFSSEDENVDTFFSEDLLCTCRNENETEEKIDGWKQRRMSNRIQSIQDEEKAQNPERLPVSKSHSIKSGANHCENCDIKEKRKRAKTICNQIESLAEEASSFI